MAGLSIPGTLDRSRSPSASPQNLGCRRWEGQRVVFQTDDGQMP
jgi:hypothetical protein